MFQKSLDFNRIAMEFPATLTNVDLATEEVLAFVSTCGLGKYRFDILLIVREALTNAVRHGSRESPLLSVHCSLHIEGNILTLEIHDEGDGFDWKAALANESVPTVDAESGRGLLILKLYATAVSYNKKGNLLRVVKHCNDRT